MDNLQKIIKKNKNNLQSVYTLQSDLSSVVQQSEFSGVYASHDLLNGLCPTPALNSIVLYSDYSSTLNGLNKNLSDIEQSMATMPNHYGSVADVKNLNTLVYYLLSKRDIVKQQQNQVIQGYLPRSIFDSSDLGNSSKESAKSTVQSIQSTVNGMLANIKNVPSSYIKASDAITKYTQLFDTDVLTTKVQNLTNNTSIANGLKILMDDYFVPIAHLEDLGTKITKLGKPADLYATKENFNKLKSSSANRRKI